MARMTPGRNDLNLWQREIRICGKERIGWPLEPSPPPPGARGS